MRLCLQVLPEDIREPLVNHSQRASLVEVRFNFNVLKLSLLL